MLRYMSSRSKKFFHIYISTFLPPNVPCNWLLSYNNIRHRVIGGILNIFFFMVISTLYSLVLLSIHTHLVHIEIVLKFTKRHALIEKIYPCKKDRWKCTKKRKTNLSQIAKKNVLRLFLFYFKLYTIYTNKHW